MAASYTSTFLPSLLLPSSSTNFNPTAPWGHERQDFVELGFDESGGEEVDVDDRYDNIVEYRRRSRTRSTVAAVLR